MTRFPALAAALTVALLVAPAALAQDVHDPAADGYSFRAVLGDDPKTRVVENPTLFRVNETFPVVNAGTANLTEVRVFIPANAHSVSIGPDYARLDGTIVPNQDPNEEGSWTTYRYPEGRSVPPGAAEPGFTVRYFLPAVDLDALRVQKRGVPEGLPSYAFLVIVGQGVVVRSDRGFAPLAFEVYKGYDVYAFSADPGGSFRLTFEPGTLGLAAPSSQFETNWLLVGVAFAGGAVIAWGLRSMKRTPRANAARGAAARSVPELEARRRVFMAALKELEMAHRGGEIAADAYGPLKAELKAETVKVMGELERRAAQSPS